ncbi:hypothetical protein [Maricaulis sp. CAU 1757]
MAEPKGKPDSAMLQAVSEFGDALTRYADNVVESLTLAEEPDEVEVANGLRDALRAQSRTLVSSTRELMEGIGEDAAAMLDTRARESGLASLTASAKGFATQTRTARIGIVALIEPIKKLLRQILDALGLSLPSWINKILDFINNLIRVLSGLLGKAEGRRAERTQATMYRHLRDIYMTDAAQLAFAQAGQAVNSDDEI